MPPRRRSAAASAASSKTSTRAPSRSTRSSSSKSTPATSIAPSSEDEATKKPTNTRKRRRQDDMDSDAIDESDKENEPENKSRGRKKRTISKVIIEIPAPQETVKAPKKAAPKIPGPSRNARAPAKSRRSSVLVSASKNRPSPPEKSGSESEHESEEDSDDDSGSEFDGSDIELEDAPEEELAHIKTKSQSSRRRAKSMDSDALDDGSDENASEDEALMLEAAIHASLAPDVDENGAGPSKSRPSAATARNKAAALRAAAAERRLGVKKADSGSDEFELDDGDDDEESAVLTDDSDEPLNKPGKSAKQTKKTGTMTIAQMRAERRAAKAASRSEMAPIASALRKKRKELGRKLTWAERTSVMLTLHHPELEDVWGDLERTIKPVAPQKADQPEGLKVTLLPFQRESLYWMRKQETGPWAGGMLADEMGMGKTIQTLALLVSDRQKPNLVVAPTVAIMQWKNEIEAHTEGFKVYMFHGGSREKNIKELAKYDIVLTSYSVLESSFRKQISGFKRKGEIVKEKSPLHALNWRRIILDEAHNIKERSTNTAKGAFELKGDYRWCLSGTPLQNRVGELYSLVRFIGGDPFSYYFCKRCPCKSLHWRFSDKKGCDDCGHSPMNHTCFWNNEILTPIQKNGMIGPGAIAFKKLKILLDRMMLRRTKVERADDLGLPPRTVVVRRDYFSPEEKELYLSLFSDAKRQFSTYVDAGTVLNNYSNIFSLLTRMRQMACHPDLVLKSKRNADLSGHITEAMVCRLCNDLAEDAIQSRCKHTFDRECIKQYLNTAIEQQPACPVCHVPISIDLEGPALEQDEEATAKARQGILGRLDVDTWRSSSKIEALIEELDTLRRQDATIKSIVFSQFVNFLDLIAFRLQRAGFSICRLEGSMSPEARNNTIQHFMNNVEVTVFLVSLKAGGVALNLTEASRVYLMDSWWNPAVEYQAMDRIHRLGQKRPVQAIKLVVEDSIESRIVQLQEKKSAMVDATLSADDNAIGRLTPEDGIMDVKDETKIQDFHFQQWFGGIAPDPNILSPTETQDQGLQVTDDADDHADEMWNDPPDLFEHTPEDSPSESFEAPHATQQVHQFSHSEPIAPRPAHDPPQTRPAQPEVQMYTMQANSPPAAANGHQQINTPQPYYPNGAAYSTPMPQYTMTANHQTPNAPPNNAAYNTQYMTYAPSPHHVWQANNGVVYQPNGQNRPISEPPVDSILANHAASPPPPQATPPIYAHPQYTNSPVSAGSHQPLPPQQGNYGYTWTPEQLQMIQQQRQQRQPAEIQSMPHVPSPAPAQPPYRATVQPISQMQHRVQQAQSASPITMSPTMMHMGNSPVPFTGQYQDMFSVGTPAFVQAQHSSSNPAGINPQALSQPPVVKQPKLQQVDTIHLYKQYMQPQMMDAAPAETAKKLIKLLTAEDTPETDPQTRLWLLTRIRDGAGKEFFKTWANDADAMFLIKEWLRSATPSKDGKTEGGNNPLEWQETIMPLLQVIDRLPLGINQLRKSKIGSNILKLAKNPPNGGKRSTLNPTSTPSVCAKAAGILAKSVHLQNVVSIRDLASTLENRYRSLVDSHQATSSEDGKPAAGKRTEGGSRHFEFPTDMRGVKRKSETPPTKSGAPAKRAAITPTPSPAALVAQRLIAQKKEKEKETRAAAGTVTKETKSDSSFFTDTKPKPAPVKRVLPSFTKKSASTPASDVAQPSSHNTFEEALAHLGVKPKAGTPTAPEAMEGVAHSASRAPSISLEPNKKRKRVTFKPEEHLVEVRWIEKAIYDDDPDAFGTHHSVRDLDRDEGAAMHKQLVFEELIDWTEPIALVLSDVQLPERGLQSEEAHIQAEREKTALLAHYQPGAIPPWPTEIPVPNVDDSQTKIMLAGEDIDSLSEKPASVAELLAKIKAPAPTAETPAPPPMFESLKDLGIDPSTFTQMLQQHNIAPVIHPAEQAPAQPPTQPRHGSDWTGDRTEGGWNEHGPSGYDYEHSHRSRFDDRGRGRPLRGRGRGGRPDTDRGQKVCYFYPLGNSALERSKFSIIASVPPLTNMLSALISIVLGSSLAVSAFPSDDLDLVSGVPKLTTLGAKCGKSASISCRNTTVQEDLCCFNAPGGQFLLTQFWDFSPAVGPKDSWTIHGLWPDHCDGSYDANCAPERELFNITTVLEQSGQQKLLKYINQYWLNNNGTNEEFWEHEYNKHGTCISTLEPQCFKKSSKNQFPELVTYMTKTVELFQDLPTYKWLKAKGIVPSTTTTYTLAQIQQAVAAKTGFIPTVGCNKQGYLSEMWYHYVVQGSVGTGKFIHSAPDGPKSSCPETGIKYVPKGTVIPTA
ncbi:SNF2 family N-terminal domain [Rhizoctonia solani]|uniref:ribonuclease T2 n=2 Tax=Rhizoctonia solani TaxID=456999 RepID=A0A8H7HA22_9AGAM|nr:SNF2 family N-terminal domain [Rhizoctonia solani]